MTDGTMFSFDIPAYDMEKAGAAASEVKRLLGQSCTDQETVRKAAVAMYEAEINAVIHGGGGRAVVEIFPDRAVIRVQDTGPGIPDLELAMQEGWSTATHSIRAMGFGAGLGLPNMRKYADDFDIQTEVGVGTTVTLVIYL